MQVKKRLFVFLTVMALWIILPTIARAEGGNVTPVFDENVSCCFNTIGKLAFIPTKDNYSVMQGGGADGKYAYYAMISPIKHPNEAVIYKYDMETWKCVAVSEPLPLGHANDITYDPALGCLLVAYANIKRICYVDPDMLSYMGDERTPVSFSRLEYLTETGQVLVGTGYTLAKFSKDNWKTIDSYFDCEFAQYVTQGLTSDGVYIYDIRWNDNLYEASLTDKSLVCDYIVVHDLDGRYFGSFPVCGLKGEPENIIWLGGMRFAIGCNGSDSVYLTELCMAD